MQRGVTAFPEQDPLWAVLSQPGNPGGARYLEELFATGRREVDEVLAGLAERGIALGRARALDFGCGIGPLTRALAAYFAECDGVDTSASLIEHARSLGDGGGRVRFHHATSDDLRLFSDASFDFILALTGLRHMRPASAQRCIHEFVRVLRPGGVALINLPEGFVPAQELPPEGWHATMTASADLSSLSPGEVFPLRLSVRNDSPIPWPSSALLRVGHWWRRSDGAVVADGATGPVIPETVNPGGDYELHLWAVAPLSPGEYELEADLRHEELGWFADRGSRALRLRAAVVAEEATTAGAEAVGGERAIAVSEHLGSSSASEAHMTSYEGVIAAVEDAGGVVLEVLRTHRSDPSTRSFDYVLARPLSPAPIGSPRAQSEQRGAIEARIRRALRYSAGSVALSKPLHAADLQRSQRRRAALGLIEERADLVGFGLTSRLRGLARASTLAREGLRRALFEVLFRQSEFNRASGELIRGHEEELDALGATLRAQLDIQAGADERLLALEDRVARLEVDNDRLARRAEGEAARPRLTDPHEQD